MNSSKTFRSAQRKKHDVVFFQGIPPKLNKRKWTLWIFFFILPQIDENGGQFKPVMMFFVNKYSLFRSFCNFWCVSVYAMSNICLRFYTYILSKNVIFQSKHQLFREKYQFNKCWWEKRSAIWTKIISKTI